MKKPEKLEKTDFVQPEIPLQLQPEFAEILNKNEEESDGELWSTDSLCFRYYNIL